jgi:hypothetical protein
VIIGLVILVVLGLAFIWFWGLLIGGLAVWYEHKHPELAEPSTHVNILTRDKPYDWSQETEGWDGSEELTIDDI